MLGAIALGTLGLSLAADGAPKPKREPDLILDGWPDWVLFRTSRPRRALGFPDLMIPVALGRPQYSRRPIWRWTNTKAEFDAAGRVPHGWYLKDDAHPQSEARQAYGIDVEPWWLTSDVGVGSPRPEVLRLVERIGVFPVYRGSYPGGLPWRAGVELPRSVPDPMWVDVDNNVALAADLPSHWAPRQALEWGFSLALIPDNFPDDPTGSSLRGWYIVHPWPIGVDWERPPRDHKARDVAAAKAMAVDGRYHTKVVSR